MNRFRAGLLGLLLGVLLGAWVGRPLVSGDNVYEQLRKFNEALNYIYRNYVEEVDSQKLVESAIRGMLQELDPHSIYIPVSEMQRVEEDFRGSFEGIGIEFDVINDTITVIAPIAGGPAEALGIQAGDKIVTIDGQNAVGLSRNEVPRKLRGPKGTTVRVGIRRAGVPGILEFTIVRDRIPIYSVGRCLRHRGHRHRLRLHQPLFGNDARGVGAGTAPASGAGHAQAVTGFAWQSRRLYGPSNPDCR
jgi:Periplasmic protease